MTDVRQASLSWRPTRNGHDRPARLAFRLGIGSVAWEGWLGGRRMNGYGTARYANGGIYTGGFVDGEREGEGTLVYASGEEVTGMWEDGQLMGGADPLSANRVSD